MPEVRFKVDDTLYAKATELQQLGHFDTVGSAVRSLMGVFLQPSIDAIKRSQSAISAGGVALAPHPVPVITSNSPPAAHSSSALGGFGESLSSLLKH